jgi:diguanylate cyclase (GGDEF)-like protein/PAS domain S-box-containing protein
MFVTSELYREVLDNLNEGMYIVDQERRIVFWNSSAEKLTGYTDSDVLGMTCQGNLLRHTNYRGAALCRDSCPMEKCFKDMRVREIDVYTHRKDGSRLLSRVQYSPLKCPDGETMVAVKFFSASDVQATNKRLYDEQYRKASYHEKIPVVSDRATVEINLTSGLDELRRYGWFFGVIIIAVDRIESIVEQYGYPYAYKVLKLVAETLMANLRSSDIVGRWNEQEFVVIAKNVGTRELKTIGERVRVAIAQSHLTFFKERISFTVSIGASGALEEDSLPALTQRCVVLLRKSTSLGGNCVSV